MDQLVYDFADGSREMRDLLGGKGANVAEMTRVLGAERVPAGFTITTEACVAYMERRRHVARRAGRAGRRGAGAARGAGRASGSATPGTRCSSRCARGARESMPGMLDTVLNLGLNDASAAGLAATTGNERFAWDSYRRFVQMYGNVVRRHRRARASRTAIAAAKRERGVTDDTELDAEALQELATTFQGVLRVPAGPAGPAARSDPRGVRLVEGRARRRLPAHQPHPRRLGHGGQRPADGLRQQGRHVGLGRRVQPRRDHRRAGAVGRLPPQRPGRGRRLRRAHAARHRGARRLDARRRRAAAGDPRARSSATTATCRTPSSRSRRGVSTCCRRATPSARPRRRCASPSTPSPRGCSTAAPALLTIDAEKLDALLHPTFDPQADYDVLAHGVAASPGAAQGAIVFTAADAIEAARTAAT